MGFCNHDAANTAQRVTATLPASLPSTPHRGLGVAQGCPRPGILGPPRHSSAPAGQQESHTCEGSRASQPPHVRIQQGKRRCPEGGRSLSCGTQVRPLGHPVSFLSLTRLVYMTHARPVCPTPILAQVPSPRHQDNENKHSPGEAGVKQKWNGRCAAGCCGEETRQASRCGQGRMGLSGQERASVCCSTPRIPLRSRTGPGHSGIVGTAGLSQGGRDSRCHLLPPRVPMAGNWNQEGRHPTVSGEPHCKG